MGQWNQRWAMSDEIQCAYCYLWINMHLFKHIRDVGHLVSILKWKFASRDIKLELNKKWSIMYEAYGINNEIQSNENWKSGNRSFVVFIIMDIFPIKIEVAMPCIEQRSKRKIRFGSCALCTITHSYMNRWWWWPFIVHTWRLNNPHHLN